MLVPVRFQGMRLIEKLAKIVPEEVDLLVTNLPQLLAVCDITAQMKQSFFMVLKSVISSNKSAYEKLFEVFGKRVLVECITHVEDSVKVVVCQLLAEFTPSYMQQPQLLLAILDKLTEALKSSDDIEGSCLHVFDLIT